MIIDSSDKFYSVDTPFFITLSLSLCISLPATQLVFFHLPLSLDVNRVLMSRFFPVKYQWFIV